jgi:hypothetical protein
MAEFSKAFLERTIKAWQPYSPAPLSLEDAKEIAENITGLFCLLNELEQKYGKEKTQS